MTGELAPSTFPAMKKTRKLTLVTPSQSIPDDGLGRVQGGEDKKGKKHMETTVTFAVESLKFGPESAR